MKTRIIVDIVGDYRVALALSEGKLLNVLSSETVLISRRGRCVATQLNRLGNERMNVFIKVQPNGGYVSP
jgi:hypothetical protein